MLMLNGSGLLAAAADMMLEDWRFCAGPGLLTPTADFIIVDGGKNVKKNKTVCKKRGTWYN